MDQQHDLVRSAARRTKRRRALLAVLLSASIATLGAGAMSLAQFTDSKASTGSWSTGTIVLGVSPSTVFTASGIFPGASGSQDVTVSNTGTGAMRYSLTTSATNADTKNLKSVVLLTVSPGTCASPGASLYSGAVASAAFGDPTQGVQGGERVLAAAGSETLCFAWSLPLATGNAYQGAATTATFTFDAEQTANNP